MQKVIQKRWEKFEDQVLKDSPLLQRSEMRLAFIAGMYDMNVAVELMPIEHVSYFVDAVREESEKYTKEKSTVLYDRAKEE